MTGLASRKTTIAALVTGTLAVGLLTPATAGALAPGHDNGNTATRATTVTTAPAAAAPATAPTTAKAASYVNGKVVSAVALRIRSRAATNAADLGSLAPNTVVKLSCKVHGQNVGGNDVWYDLYSRSGWVAARYVRNVGVVPFC
ncbi:SH3 domain-containing protein [Actinacidiphila acidipaludis]|uniref:SH3 domain-containing protein n=1 Tax=Actinacidiphila acidipaludis TaxID=2873382 RepID=A0ABS7Q7Y7_9ACTN|nr:SH3 domain-containing protein [Streptomyces acidipaludis]MBY8879063.1 SH3 domain-containing protein [Streptomyces acidipaludis]